MAGEAITVLFSTYQPDIKSVHVECFGYERYVADSGVLLEEGREENAQGQAVLLEGPTDSGHQDSVELDSRPQVRQQEEEQRVACEQRKETFREVTLLLFSVCLLHAQYYIHEVGSVLSPSWNRALFRYGKGAAERLFGKRLWPCS